MLSHLHERRRRLIGFCEFAIIWSVISITSGDDFLVWYLLRASISTRGPVTILLFDVLVWADVVLEECENR